MISALSAQSATITTVACASQVVTVTCSGACGIAQYQGFSIAGSSVSTYNLNSTAATSTTGSFTFTLPSSTPCNGSATGGTVTPAKQIIALQVTPSANGIIATYAFWYTTINPIPLACPNLACPVSAWNGNPAASPPTGASAAENAAIVAGTTVESVISIPFALSTSGTSIAAQIVAQYSSTQASYNTGFLGYVNYYYNGTSWVP